MSSGSFMRRLSGARDLVSKLCERLAVCKNGHQQPHHTYFTQPLQNRISSVAGTGSSGQILRGHLPLNSLPHLPQPLITATRFYSQHYFRRFEKLSPRLRKLYIFGLSSLCVAIGAFLEEYWLKKSFSDIIPDNAAMIGQKVPAKYIYGPYDGSLSSWMYHYLGVFSSCDSSAWNYVTMTKSRDPQQRENGIRKLSAVRGLSDIECHIIASALDFKTAIAIAHAGGDPRIVSQGRKLHPNKRNMCLAGWFRHIFGVLPVENIHRVMHNACVEAIQGFKPTEAEVQARYMDTTAGFEAEFVASPLKHCLESTFLKPCLQGLLSHCRLTYQIPAVLENDVMDVLLVISDKYRDDHVIMGLVAKIFSCISCHPLSDAYFEKADLLGLIADLARDEDVRLSFPALKTLHNLDSDSVQYVLPPGIYQYYPEFRTDESKAVVDVVFVHGIMGGAFRTWRSQDLRAIWKFTKNDPSDTLSSCETNEEAIQGRYGLLRNQSPAEPVFKDPFYDLDDYNFGESENVTMAENGLLLSVTLNNYEYVVKNSKVPEPAPRNRELRNGTMYYYPKDEEIPLELGVVENPPTSECWPRDWLSVDVPNIRILAADFDTFITKWNPVMPIEMLSRTIADRSRELMQRFADAGIGDRPVIWIMHSAGGIFTKKLLKFCEESDDERYRKMVKNTRGVLFFSTPHFGSKMAGLGKIGQKVVLPAIEVKELTAEDPANQLQLIDEDFQKIKEKHGFRVISFGERCPSLGTLGVKAKLVTIDSSDPGYGEYYGLRVDHLNICKPRSKLSFVYNKVVQVLREVIAQEQTPSAKPDPENKDEKTLSQENPTENQQDPGDPKKV